VTTVELLAPRVAEPLLAAGAFTHRGAASTLVGGPLGLLGVLRGRHAAGGLPSRVLVGVTADRVVAFAASMRWQPGEEVASWRRDGLAAGVRRGPMGPVLRLAGGGGPDAELQGVNVGANAVADLLTR
jgi:hypothetical protein